MAVAEDTLAAVRAVMQGLRAPNLGDKVYKEECMLSFDTPESPGGLFVNLRTFQAFGAEHVGLDHERTGCGLYLHQKWQRVPKPEAAAAAAAEAPTKMAIGVEGGFALEGDAYELLKENALVVMPARTSVPLPCPELPELVLGVVDGVLAHADATSAQEDTSHLAWEEERHVSKYAADLVQEDNGKRITPDASKWVCEESGETENLWLNLSDGFIGSGRRQWDGSGGNGAALRHYQAMKVEGKEYPLVVKLGTITPTGADVFSYAVDEDDLVEDPKLAEHLAHWGIDVMKMEKTEKSMSELNIDMNRKFEWDKITEAGSELKALSGPGYIGLKNLGNSCYINSVVQILKEIPELSARYLAPADAIFRSAPADIAEDFPAQMAKLWTGLLTGRYADVAAPADGEAEGATSAVCVQPRMFKTLVGKNHSEFRTSQQQDAVEYFQHLLEFMSRAERAAGDRLAAGGAGPSEGLFKLKMEERICCVESGKVKYKTNPENTLSLFIPLDAATNQPELNAYNEREQKRQKLKQEGAQAYIPMQTGGEDAASALDLDGTEEPVQPIVPFSACVATLAGEERFEFTSSALGRKSMASRTTRIASFPKYLVVQMRKFYVGDDWTPKKMDVLVEVPEEISLEHLRATGMQPGEEPLPDDTEAAGASGAAAAPVEPDAVIVSQLMAMGFSENGSKRAALATNNASVDSSMQWVLEHMEDANFNDPLEPPAAAAAAGAGDAADPEKVSQLKEMGFSDTQATASLMACQGSIERAAEWLFSRMDNLDEECAKVLGEAAGGGGGGGAAGGGEAAAQDQYDDGPGHYTLMGFVSHMGSNTSCGHYVCHIKKEGRWVIYNDRKVAESTKPPLGLGYLYFFKRNDVA